MVQSARRLRSIESLEEQFLELDRRMAAGAETQTPRPAPRVDQPAAGAAALRAVEDSGKGHYLRLAAHERRVPHRSRRDP